MDFHWVVFFSGWALGRVDFLPSWLFCQVGYESGWLWAGLALSQIGFWLHWVSVFFWVGFAMLQLALGLVGYEAGLTVSQVGFLPGLLFAKLALHGPG